MNRSEFINLTPHQITIETTSGRVEIEPSGEIARVEASTSELGEVSVNGAKVQVSERKFGKVEGLPDYSGTARIYAKTSMPIYIVSALVLAACPARDDIAAPDTGESAIRDAAGKIVAVTQLIMNKCAFPDDDDEAF